MDIEDTEEKDKERDTPVDIEHDIDFRPIYLSNVDFCNERYYYIDNMTNI